MKEAVDSLKNEIKNRMTSPFYGKLIVAWLLWNWKVPYVTFFVKEENIENKNRLDFIADYLSINSLYDFRNIYLIPILITIVLIWLLPYVTHEAYKSKENFRKKKAIKKKKVDRFIDGNTDRRIRQLSEEIKTLSTSNKENRFQISELKKLATYLSEDPILFDENYWEKLDFLQMKFKKEITENKNKDKVLLMIDNYNEYYKDNNYFSVLNISDRNFLISSTIIEENNNDYKLSEFGGYISRTRLYNKYQSMIDKDFKKYHF